MALKILRVPERSRQVFRVHDERSLSIPDMITFSLVLQISSVCLIHLDSTTQVSFSVLKKVFSFIFHSRYILQGTDPTLMAGSRGLRWPPPTSHPPSHLPPIPTSHPPSNPYQPPSLPSLLPHNCCLSRLPRPNVVCLNVLTISWE